MDNIKDKLVVIMRNSVWLDAEKQIRKQVHSQIRNSLNNLVGFQVVKSTKRIKN